MIAHGCVPTRTSWQKTSVTPAANTASTSAVRGSGVPLVSAAVLDVFLLPIPGGGGGGDGDGGGGGSGSATK